MPTAQNQKPLVALMWIALFIAVSVVGCSDDVDSAGPDASIDTGTDVGFEDVPDDIGPTDDLGLDTDPDHDTGGESDADTTPDAPSDPDIGDPDGGDQPDADPDELPDLEVDELRPTRGPLDGGTPFVVEGQGFTPDTVVLFGGHSVETEIVDDDLTGISPAGDVVGPVTVRVIDNQTGDDTLVDGFTYIEPLQIESVQPNLVPVEGGAEITISGGGFSEDSRVSVNTKPALSHTLVNSQTLRFVAPPNAAGPADVRVTDQDSTAHLEDALTYVQSVQLTSVDPPFGDAAGGDEITLYGQGFDSGLQVFFDEVTAAITDIAADGTQATAVTPGGTPGLVDVRVETDDDGARLDDGFAYLDASASIPAIDAVVPDRGSTAGGDPIHITGFFGDFVDPVVDIGPYEAAIVEHETQVLTVDSPQASQPGTLDVTVRDSSEEVTAENSFTYYDPLTVNELSPADGPVEGGTEVTVTGTGFDALSELRLGGVSLSFDVQDGDALTFSTPAAAPGPADLQLIADDGRTHHVDEAFYFIGNLELWGFEPTRGSVAGNTYIELRGTGFSDSTQVYFGDLPATTIEVFDPYTMAVTAPAHDTGAVTVSADSPTGEAEATELYTYFNPGAATGGAWGNPINGAVNITVFSIFGAPIENAFVMLSTNAQTPYTGTTNAGGLVTLSGPDILGSQTISATAAGHSSATVQHVDAENITIFLHPDVDGDPELPPPPPTATFRGDITGLDKLQQPAPNEILMAVVETTRPTIYDDLPDPGGGNIVTEDGEYVIQTRVGELALVAMAGLYNVDTEEFRPTRMGAARYLTAADGGDYEVDIDLDIPLDSSIELKMDGPPLAPGGPDTRRAQLFLDLSVDGVFGPMHEYLPDSDVSELDAMAPLVGDISDGLYRLLVQSDRNGGAPLSQTFITGIDELEKTYVTEPMVATVDIQTPASGGVANDGLVQWELQGIHAPDFYYVFLETFMQETVWEIFLPGNVTSFQFPDFPEFDPDDFDEEEGTPFPYPGGTYSMGIVGYRKDGLTADTFTYDDLNPANATGYSLTGMLIGL